MSDFPQAYHDIEHHGEETIFKIALLCSFFVLPFLPGCSVGRFDDDAEFREALRRSQPVIARLDQMPTSDPALLASSASARAFWGQRAMHVFENTAYLGATLRVNFSEDTEVYYLSHKGGIWSSVGKGRPVGRGYLGKGYRKTDGYAGSAYVYSRRNENHVLRVFIAAEDFE